MEGDWLERKGWRHPRREETTYLKGSNSSTKDPVRGVKDELVCRREPANLRRSMSDKLKLI
jgi:hypothetical protein